MKVYDEYCAMARGLEIVGDRWTLLIIRELLLGDRRFTDLIDGLPGIPRNLLSARLDQLLDIGLAEQIELPPPTPVTLYRLTSDGARLEETVLALTRWGTSFLGTPGDQHRRGAWLGLLISAWREGDRPPLTGELEVRLGEQVFHLRSDRTGIRARYGPASKPEAILTTDWRPLYHLLTAEIDVQAFLQDESTRVEGDDEFLTQTLEWLQSGPGRSKGVDLADAWIGPAKPDRGVGDPNGEVIDA